MSTALEEPIRIISDLHFGHPASIIEDAEQIRPLLRGAKTVVFNGDTVELRYLRGRRLGQRNGRLIRELCHAEGVHPIFLTGNHDPVISEIHHLDLAGGAVLATHGDMLFHDISPWSAEASIMGKAHTLELASLGEDKLLDFESRLKASKSAARSIELHRTRLNRGPLSALRTVVRECWPPWRPLQIVHSWMITPALAEAMARVFRPRARFILIGHTHYSGCWRRGPRVVINTGSYLPIGGRRIVDLCGTDLEVRAVRLENGAFHPGAVLRRYAVSPLPGETAS